MTFSAGDIVILDDALPLQDRESLTTKLSAAIWRFGWPINDAFFSRPCWHAFIAGKRRPEQESCEYELAEQWGALASLWNSVKERYISGARLLGVYANGQTFGQDSPIHRDNWGVESGATVLVFCNEYWPTCWGGELTFYDQRKENVIKSILPKPGRVVIFDGRIPHAARSPSVDCDQLRMTIAFKTILSPGV